MLIKRSVFALLLLASTSMMASAQTASDDFKKMVNDHMAVFCPRISNLGDKAACELEHRLVVVKVTNAEAIAANADLYRQLGQHDKADATRARMIAMLKEAGADLDRLKATYRK